MSTEEPILDSLIVQGAKYITTLTPKFKSRKVWKAHNPNLIYTFIPGTIIEVLVKEGQKVKQGETLAVFDAMKMRNNVVMPFDGEIIKINIQPKDTVSLKNPMMEIRPR